MRRDRLGLGVLSVLALCGSVLGQPADPPKPDVTKPDPGRSAATSTQSSADSCCAGHSSR